MQIAIDVLERELNMLENNFQVTENILAQGGQTRFEDPEAQQELRLNEMQGIREGIDYLKF